MPPTSAGYTYGHEYLAADFDAALALHGATDDDPTSPTWVVTSLPGYPIKASARDTDGHGTHVTGTSAGDGSGSGLTGVAPDAEIIFVKFDFEDAAGRNTDAAIIDGVAYIFKRAAALGRPAVINMSLGSDFGPHDGTSLEERGIDALTGPGKVVVVAAGNPGANNWSQQLRWGYAMHGSGALNVDAITLRIPPYVASATDNYAFFDVFYPAGRKCRVKVTTPSGVQYPPSGTKYKTTWTTGSPYTGFDTTSGGILVGNGGDQLGWGMTTTDHEAYIELSDYYGKLPASGTWTITLVPATSTSNCSGTFHAWYGVSGNIVKGWQAERAANPSIPSTPRFGGRESDNRVTIGTPASANRVIAVAAYMTRDEWPFAYGVQPDGVCLPEAAGLQR
ncbi:MAG: S8 family serine peptidase, partial [Deltaproteobacteria bacterium]|nr:S8 family serine peptidase [Deltaproteobacteria bacterium]